MYDLERELKSAAYHTADRDKCEPEETPEWRAMLELAAWRSVMPQYEFVNGAIHRKPETLPPWGRPKPQ